MRGFIILKTVSFSALDPDVQAELMRIALTKINTMRNWIVFDPETETEKIEDEGRTLRVPFRAVPERVYVILEDYGSPEALARELGREIPVPGVRYLVTFLLASEY